VFDVMLDSVNPKTIDVVAEGAVYTVMSVFSAVLDPSNVFNLNIFAMFLS